MIYAALWKKLTDRETPFRAEWGWIISGLTMALIGASPLLLLHLV